MSQVLQHVIEAIGPASQANAEAVRARVAQANAPVLERLAASLAAAQHTPRPRTARRMIVVVAGDHGCGDPGIAMGADHPTVIAAHAIADGSAALCQVARTSGGFASVGSVALDPASLVRGTPIVLVDAGSREPAHMPDIAIQLGRGPSRDLMREPAMTIVDAALALDAGIALSISLADRGSSSEPSSGAPRSSGPSPDTQRSSGPTPDTQRSSGPTPDTQRSSGPTPDTQRSSGPTPDTHRSSGPMPDTQRSSGPMPDTQRSSGPMPDTPRSSGSTSDMAIGRPPDVIALGALGLGSEVASAAILAALSGQAPSGLHDDIAEAAGIRGLALRGAGPLEILATFGGSDTAVLAGLILGAASMNVAVILDSYATGAAAMIAAAFAPHVTGYLIAAHRGSFTQPAILDHLGLAPAFDVGLGHGEGTGAAMVLPLLDQVAALAGRG